jgi:hypothetical protein
MNEQEREEHRTIDLTTSEVQGETDRGSAWAELDETFFRITADVFPRQLCFGMSVLLASNDEPEHELARQRSETDAADRLSHQDLLERVNAEIDRELEIRRAMRRHPSRRRF